MDRGGLPNALFLVASAEALPTGLGDIADELRITLPWGALLRAAVAPEVWFTDLVGRLLRPGGGARLVLSVGPSDHVPGLAELGPQEAEGLAARYRCAGFRVDASPVTAADVAGLGSSWAKRLGIPGRRAAWSFRLGDDVAGGGERCAAKVGVGVRQAGT